jgi:UDP-hydrolysing UDP-N-acetyl-D-glucosamine 2-epimerase
MKARSIGVVTTGRSDYGMLSPVVRALQRRRAIDVRWLVTGMHLSRRLGYSVDQIRADRWRCPIRLVEGLLDADTPSATALGISATTAGFAHTFAHHRPDLLVVLGDRFETLGAVSAAVPFRIPIAHVHGGECTEGAFDDGVRHAITKLSHLHFVSHAEYGRRVRQLGEERWRVVVSGSPGLDETRQSSVRDLADIEAVLGGPIDRTTLLVTFHPETLRPVGSLKQLDDLLTALDELDCPTIVTTPNADPGRDTYADKLDAFVKRQSRRILVANLGARYFTVLSRVGAMVGNSSSGIIEAPSFHLPVVNIGTRQRGRLHAANVIDVNGTPGRIKPAIEKALSPAFRKKLHNLKNPYGDGRAGERIAKVIASVPIDDRLLIKRFADTSL